MAKLRKQMKYATMVAKDLQNGPSHFAITLARIRVLQYRTEKVISAPPPDHKYRNITGNVTVWIVCFGSTAKAPSASNSFMTAALTGTEMELPNTDINQFIIQIHLAGSRREVKKNYGLMTGIHCDIQQMVTKNKLKNYLLYQKRLFKCTWSHSSDFLY